MASSMKDLITVHVRALALLSRRLLIPHEVNGRIFLDYKSHLENNYGLSTVLYSRNGIIRPKEQTSDRKYHYFRRRSDADDTRLTEDQVRSLNDMKCYPNNAEYLMTDDQALLCPARIRGFALSEKQWAFFLLENVQDITWSESAFDKLELDGSIKSKVQALVEIHYTKNDFDDLVAGKGRGLVVLLHGPPGTGKTLTAGKRHHPHSERTLADHICRKHSRIHPPPPLLHRRRRAWHGRRHDGAPTAKDLQSGQILGLRVAPRRSRRLPRETHP